MFIRKIMPLEIDQKPAAHGGKPVFDELTHIIKPTLSSCDNIEQGVQGILSSGEITNSRYVKSFERECASFLGVRHAVAVSSATSALVLAVKGLGLTGEVIVPSFTSAATVHSLVWNNVKPVFVDCEEGTCNIDVSEIESKITPMTSAIMAVSTFGNPPKNDALVKLARKLGLKLIYDSAQGFGAEYKGKKIGPFGSCEVFSFSPTKVLTTIEGGIVTTNDDELAGYVRSARDYGKSGDDMASAGLSARMSEIHAYFGIRNFNIIEECLYTRRELIGLYKRMLKGLDGLSFQEIELGNKSSGNYMVIFVDPDKFGMTRDELYEALAAENIQTRKYFHPPVHLLEAYSELGSMYRKELPVTEKISAHSLVLPLYGHMKVDTVEKVCVAVKKIYNWQRKRIRV